MAKRNVRAKAKSAVGAVKQKAQAAAAQINRAARQDKMLHKTLTPKQTTTKKERTEEKHKKLLKRFVDTKKEMKAENARKNREKTKVIGDLQPLKDALPSLGDIFTLVKNQKKTTEENSLEEPKEKLSVKKKIKKKREEYAQRLKSFDKLINDKNFRKNPREIVANHVRNKYQAMEEEEEEIE